MSNATLGDSNSIGIVSAAISLVSLIVSAIAAYYARSATREAEANMLNTLQSDYEAIRARMDSRYRQNDWRPTRAEPKEWVPIEEYWFFCLREWLLTKAGPNKRFAKLWDEHIRDGVKAGLRHPPLRFVLAAMLSDGTLDEGYTKGFTTESTRLHGGDFKSEFAEEIRASSNQIS
jgi:hypothetical protein